MEQPTYKPGDPEYVVREITTGYDNEDAAVYVYVLGISATPLSSRVIPAIKASRPPSTFEERRNPDAKDVGTIEM
jgi:hypothetical protein